MTSGEGLDTGIEQPRQPRPRKSSRVHLNAEVSLRRSAQMQYRVSVFDASPHGCRVEFIERPRLDERVWVKFDGLEAIEAMVCWVDGFIAGVEFETPMHAAVFASVINRIR